MVVRVDVVDDILVLATPFELRDLVKKIPGHKWDITQKVWIFNVRRNDSISGVADFLARLEGMYDVASTPAADDVLARARDALVRAREGIERVDAIKSGAIKVDDVEMPIKSTPYLHQKVAHAIGMSLDATALFMEMGTGKSLVVVSVAGQRYRLGRIKKLLIVAPLSVVDVWKREFKKHARFDYDAQIVRAGKEPIFGPGLQVMITNYDQFVQRNGKGGVLDLVKKWRPDMVVLDESQRIKNRDAKRSRAIHELADGASFSLELPGKPEQDMTDVGGVQYRMILTGTPVTQNVLDLWSQYFFLDKSVFGDNFYRFRGRYAVMGGWEGKEVIGYRNVTEISDKALKIAYRITKAEALDLPPYTDETLYCELEPETRAQYEKMKRDALLVIEDVGSSHAPQVLTQILRLGQMAGGFLTIRPEDREGTEVRQIGNEKLTTLREFIEDLPKDKKLVIFCRFLAEIDAIEKMLKAMKISAESLTGATKERGNLIDRFQQEENPRVLVIQIATGGLGIDLWRADTAVFFSYGYSFADYEQARARIHRVGQTNPVTYIHLVAKNTIDESIIDALERKQDVANVVVDRLYAKSEVYDPEEKLMMIKYRKRRKGET